MSPPLDPETDLALDALARAVDGCPANPSADDLSEVDDRCREWLRLRGYAVVRDANLDAIIAMGRAIEPISVTPPASTLPPPEAPPAR